MLENVKSRKRKVLSQSGMLMLHLKEAESATGPLLLSSYVELHLKE
jgi:hypothetical protein